MKIKVNELSLKQLINEEAYSSGFSKIQAGDLFIVSTETEVHKGKVMDKFSTQITVQIDDVNYIISANSLDGNTLSSNKLIKGKKGPNVKVSDVKSITIRRGGSTVTVLIPDNGRFGGGNKPEEKESKNKPVDTKVNKEIYDEISSILTDIRVDDKVVIKTVNEDESINQLTINVREIHEKDIVLGIIIDNDNDIENKYSKFVKQHITFSIAQSLEVADQSIVLMCKLTDGNIDFIIDNIIEIGIINPADEEEITFDDLLKNKNFMNLMSKEPSFWGKIMGAKNKGVLPMNKLLNDLGLKNAYFSKGKKVEFIYTGETMRDMRGDILNLESGKKYIGTFTSDKKIKLTGNKRGESITIKLNKEVADNVFEVNATFDKIINGVIKQINKTSGIIKVKEAQ